MSTKSMPHETSVDRALSELRRRATKIMPPAASAETPRTAERRLQQILDALFMFIGLLDTEGRLRYVNDAPLRHASLTRHQVAGLPLADAPWFAHAPDQQARVRAALRRAADGELVHEELTIRMSADQLLSVEATFTPLRDATGAVREIVGSAVDVTERKAQRERVARLTQILRLQSGINAAVVRVRDRHELLREACRLAVDCGGYHNAALWSLEPDGSHARLSFRAGEHGIDLPTLIPVSDGTEPDDNLTARALRTGEICLSDLHQAEPAVGGRAQMLEFGYQWLTSVPLVVEGKAVAALSLASLDHSQIDEEQISLLQDIGATLSFALHSQHLEHVTQYLQRFNSLTGLAGRSLFIERLQRAIAEDGALPTDRAVVTFDLRGLTSVNDSLGRHTGDALLQAVAERLKRELVGERHAAHLGGGTFALVVPGTHSSEDTLMGLLEESVLGEPFELDGRSVRASCRIGIARYPNDAQESAHLLEYAEAALKRAKDSGEQFLRYRLQMHSELAGQLTLEHQLRDALEREEFVPFYQPQMDTARGTIVALEALLRWWHPEHGIVPPDRFLPLLESSGLIVPVGEWVMRRAMQDSQRWHTLGFAPLRIAVNVAPVQLKRRLFVHSVLEVLEQVPSNWGLDLEITESSLLHDVRGANRDLGELRRAGVRVALDDFGTGYSSLGLLSRLEVDTMKIDRSFIGGLPEDSRSVTLVSSLIAIASASNLTVVAEGVETQAQYDMLRGMGCHQTQGYLHSRPAPVETIETLLPKRRDDAT